jgi:hypothetical protein
MLVPCYTFPDNNAFYSMRNSIIESIIEL